MDTSGPPDQIVAYGGTPGPLSPQFVHAFDGRRYDRRQTRFPYHTPFSPRHLMLAGSRPAARSARSHEP